MLGHQLYPKLYLAPEKLYPTLSLLVGSNLDGPKKTNTNGLNIVASARQLTQAHHTKYLNHHRTLPKFFALISICFFPTAREGFLEDNSNGASRRSIRVKRPREALDGNFS